MLRKQSSLATARQQQLPGDAVEEATQKDDLPHFMTMEGSISPLTLKALTQKPMQLTHMSPVQAKVFPLLPQLAEPYDPNTFDAERPRDLLVKARTGTGKTLAFLLPAVEARLKAIEAHGKQAVKDAGLDSDKNLEMRARRAFAQQNLGTLIISPTRELATQIAVEAQRLTSHLDDFGVNLFVGGAGKGFQMRNWMNGRRDILVSTPGRLRDFLTSEPEVTSGLSKAQLVCSSRRCIP
jgi:ATP-dependent RNA helicase MSS116, mitochondrial